MELLKDINGMKVNDEQAHEASSLFLSGESTKQEGFKRLVQLACAMVEPYVEVKENGSKALLRGASAKAEELLRDHAEFKGNDTARPFIKPAVNLAKRSIEGTTPAFEYVLDNLTEHGDTSKGDVSNGPLFSLARLQVSSGMLGIDPKNNDEVPFEVDLVDGLLLNGKRFGTYSVEDIKLAKQKGKTGKAALNLIVDFVGLDAADNGGKEKQGTMGAFLAKLRKEYAGAEGNEFVLDICDKLEEAMDDLRDVVADEREKAEENAKTKAKMERHARRLERMARRGEERDALTVADTAGAETEVD